MVDRSSSLSSEIPDYRRNAFAKEGIVSEKHGDKARFDRERKKNNIRRKRTRKVSGELSRERKTARTKGAESK